MPICGHVDPTTLFVDPTCQRDIGERRMRQMRKTAWLLLHKLRRAMVGPDRRPLRGIIEIDETNVRFRRKDEPDDGGQERSPIGKIFMIGAVEAQAGKYPARCRLQRIVNINRESLHAFIRDNTAFGSPLVTDGNTRTGACRIAATRRSI